MSNLLEMRRLLYAPLAAAALTAAPAVDPAPVTYYISPSGNDSNLGTSTGSPWKTIAAANGTAFNAGDKILFQGGATFAGDLTFDAGDGGTAQSPITVELIRHRTLPSPPVMGMESRLPTPRGSAFPI